MKMKRVVAVLLLSIQYHLAKAHLRHTAGLQKMSTSESVIQRVEKLAEEQFIQSSDEETFAGFANVEGMSTARRLQHPCPGQGGAVDGVEIE